MNEQLVQFARQRLKEDLVMIGLRDVRHLARFRRIFSDVNLTISLDNIIDGLISDDVFAALDLVDRTILHYNNKVT